jgi:hypothetical protein
VHDVALGLEAAAEDALPAPGPPNDENYSGRIVPNEHIGVLQEFFHVDDAIPVQIRDAEQVLDLPLLVGPHSESRARRVVVPFLDVPQVANTTVFVVAALLLLLRLTDPAQQLAHVVSVQAIRPVPLLSVLVKQIRHRLAVQLLVRPGSRRVVITVIPPVRIPRRRRLSSPLAVRRAQDRESVSRMSGGATTSTISAPRPCPLLRGRG